MTNLCLFNNSVYWNSVDSTDTFMTSQLNVGDAEVVERRDLVILLCSAKDLH